MFDVNTLKKELKINDKSDHLIKTAFVSVIKEIKETNDDENHFETIRSYIQSVDHQFFNPLYEYSLWMFKHDYKAVLEAAAKFHENAIIAAKEKMYLFSVVSFEIAIDIYKSLGKGHLGDVKDVTKNIFETIKMIENKNEFRWNLEFLELLYTNWNYLDNENHEKVLLTIETGFQYFENIKKMHLARNYLEIKRKIVNKNGETTEIKTVLERIAMTYELEATLKKQDSAVACAFLEDAMRYYEKTGNKIKIDEIKLKLKEESKKIKYSKITTEFEIPNEEIDRFVSQLSTLKNSDVPLAIGAATSFVPKRQQVWEQTEEILKENVFLAIISTTTNRDGNSVKSSSSEEELKEHQYRKQYSHQIRYIGLFLNIVFQKLVEKESLSSEIIYTYLAKNDLFNSDDLKTTKIGFDAYFRGDYVSSLHILIPKLENIIRTLMLLVGIPTTISDKDGIREGDLGGYLRKSEVEQILGEDFTDFLKILLIEKDAINLRNLIAHGLLGYSEFDEVLASIVIFIYLHLGTFKLTKKEEN